MTTDREFEGKDLEAALAAAASALGVPAEELHYEMIEQGRRGLLGVGVKAVRIRVMPPLEAEFPVESPGGVETAPAPPAVRPGRAEPDPPTALPASAQEVERTVRRMIELMELEIVVTTRFRDGAVELKFEGPDQELLLASNAELLTSIQFLLNRMGRRAWPEAGRIHVAGEGHARPRDEELISLARKVAKQVARTGKTRRLHPLNAYERRLVHLAVREFPGLTSSSEGGGALKRIRIAKVQNQI
jgi:spoIIIJ-associated protein